MSDPTETIDSRNAFQRRLTDLVNAAERGGVNIEGGYDIETIRDEARYDIEASVVVPNRD